MKLVSFRANGASGYGVVDGDHILPAPPALLARFPTLKAALGPEGLLALRNLAASTISSRPLRDIEFLLPIPDAGKIICIGRNYGEHIKEGGRDAPEYPMLFPRYLSSLVAHGAALVRPWHSGKFDYEGELACVIGRAGRHVAAGDALGIVAGYSCLNEGSIRDWQRHTGQMMPGKNFWHSGAMGPWLVTTDEIPDPAALTLATRVNGTEVQRTSTGDMIFAIPRIIEYITSFIDLEPGDIIATGTPSGVGLYRSPQLFLKAGDTVEVEISKIGVLRNSVIDEAK